MGCKLGNMSLHIDVLELDACSAVAKVEGASILGMNLKFADGQLRGLIEKGVIRLVLDLTGVTFCDSAGLGAIVHTFGLGKDKGSTLRVCGASERVAALLKMTMTDTILPIDVDCAAFSAAIA